MKAVLRSLIGIAFGILLAGPVSARHEEPEQLELPNGFNPEGISKGPGNNILVGSIASGAVYQLNTHNGSGSVLVPAAPGHVAIGLKWDKRTNLIYVAGGPTGKVFVYSARTGATIAEVTLTTDPNTFVNDVVITPHAVYLTDSFRSVFYRLPLFPGGRFPATSCITEIPLSGSFSFVAGNFNLNGIVATESGDTLLAVSSSLGILYRINPNTGFATSVNLGGASLLNGDGLLLQGRKLFVVRNANNQIDEIQLNGPLTTGSVVRTLTNPLFDVPTTIARVGDDLYAVNARFGTPVTPATEYDVVRVDLSN
jgi:sugar lactone lactonase YvrE